MPRRVAIHNIGAILRAESESGIENCVRGFSGDRQGLKGGLMVVVGRMVLQPNTYGGEGKMAVYGSTTY